MNFCASPVLERLSNLNVLNKDPKALLSYVEGEFQDADGDWAASFLVLETPQGKRAVPGEYITRQKRPSELNLYYDTCEDCTSGRNHIVTEPSKRTSRGNVHSFRKNKEPRREIIVLSDDDMEDPMFECDLCLRNFPLPRSFLMPQCRCLFCNDCIQSYAKVQIEGLLDSVERGCQSIPDALICPGEDCKGLLPVSSCRALAPDAYDMWQEVSCSALLGADGSFVGCPACGYVIEKVVSLDEPLCNVLDDKGHQISREALFDRSQNRFRCSQCFVDFCANCHVSPYHADRSCREHQLDLTAAHCRFCDEVIPSPNEQNGFRSPKDTTKNSQSVRKLRLELQKHGLDVKWCIEKEDLLVVKGLMASVCKDLECQAKLSLACTRPKGCGHMCGGVREEVECLPCLEDTCLEAASVRGATDGDLSSREDLCSICYVETLGQAPAIRLGCNHIVHSCCAVAKVTKGCPGPHLSFGFLNCPLCGVPMEHPQLASYLRRPLEHRAKVRKKAVERLKADNRVHNALELMPGGVFEGRLEDFAEHEYRFYLCSKCDDPYYGGDRICGEAGERAAEAAPHGGEADALAGAPPPPPPPVNLDKPRARAKGIRRFFRGFKATQGQRRPNIPPPPPPAAANQGNPKDQAAQLVCGDCIAVANGKGECLRGHPKGFVEFKCKFCCNVATFFCFGSTHFCSACHASRPDISRIRLPDCKGGRDCPLKVAWHPPNGQNHCLGCALCRLDASQ